MRKFQLLLFFLPLFAHAQQYYEASGKTSVFTLAAGAKAGPAAILFRSRLTPIAAPHMFVTMQNGVHISVAGLRGQGRVSIYNLAGKTIQTSYFAGNSSIALKSDIPGGIYFARLEANGGILQSIRFWKAR